MKISSVVRGKGTSSPSVLYPNIDNSVYVLAQDVSYRIDRLKFNRDPSVLRSGSIIIEAKNTLATVVLYNSLS